MSTGTKSGIEDEQGVDANPPLFTERVSVYEMCYTGASGSSFAYLA